MAKLLKRKNVKHFQQRDLAFDENSRQEYLDSFDRFQAPEFTELNSQDRIIKTNTNRLFWNHRLGGSNFVETGMD